METLNEYQVSPRVVLRRGDRFRIGGGPYWRSADGEKIPLAARGVCSFLGAMRQGKREFVAAPCDDEFTLQGGDEIR